MNSFLLRKLVVRGRRVLWRLLTAVRPGARHVFTLPDSSRFEYPLSSAIGADLFAGWFEPAEVAFVRGQLREGDVVLDVGANAGLYTVLAARAVGTAGHVFAFEPDERALALLRRNIALNGLTNVTVIEAAVSNRTGRQGFAAADDIAMSSLAEIQRDDQRIEAWRTVNTIRLDDAVATYAIENPSFLKIDVEGAEKLVLEGAQGLLASAPARFTIMLEGFEANAASFGYSVRELLQMLTGRGFTVYGFDAALHLRPVADGDPAIGRTVYNFVACKNPR